MIIVDIIIIIIGIVICFLGFNALNKAHKINTEVDKENQLLKEKNSNLKKVFSNYKDSIENQKILLKEITNNYENQLKNNNKLLQQGFEIYSNNLEKGYIKVEQEFTEKVQKLEKEFTEWIDKQEEEKEKVKSELDKIRNTKAAAIQAQLKEKEIKENKDFYCLPCSPTDRNDIQVLERVKKDLNKPRVLSMLIWSSYFQKPMTTLCNNVLGANVKCGIYKITNQLTNECYIGQSINIAKRWKEHAKCGLGIDTPANNKLYKAMIEQGIWNFSFELLEECPREQLDEKEKYYINLYMSNDYGYNSTKGNK